MATDHCLLIIFPQSPTFYKLNRSTQLFFIWNSFTMLYSINITLYNIFYIIMKRLAGRYIINNTDRFRYTYRFKFYM